MVSSAAVIYYTIHRRILVKNDQKINDFKTHFYRRAGVGMGAIVQYLVAGYWKNVAGSDRYFKEGEYNETKEKAGSRRHTMFCKTGRYYATNRLVVVSTAIEDTVPEVQKAKQLNIPILKGLRSAGTDCRQ